MNKTLLTLALLGMCLGGIMKSQAQNQTPDVEILNKLNPTWHTTVGKSEYVVSVNSITSVALQNYDMDFQGQTVPIVELNIETCGGAAARFYFIDEKGNNAGTNSPVAPISLNGVKLTPTQEVQAHIKELQDAAKGNPIMAIDSSVNEDNKVVKKWPEGTYAKTFEFRLNSEADIRKLYSSLMKKWTGVGQ